MISSVSSPSFPNSDLGMRKGNRGTEEQTINDKLKNSDKPMKIEVPMPKMGESLQEGTIAKWLKKVGDKIERDEPILEISTDKVDTEVPAPSSGILTKILAEESETVEVGEIVSIIETEESEAQIEDEPDKPANDEPKEQPAETEAAEEQPAKQSADDGETTDVVMPKMGESLQEGTIVQWLKKVGDKIERDEPILEISTDKVDTEVPSPVAGTLVEITAEENETVEVGQVIAKIASGYAKPAKPLPKKEEAPSPKKEKVEEKEPAAKQGGKIPRSKDGKFFSPVVRNIAQKEGVAVEELQKIKGSGIDGRITKNDLLDYIKSGRKAEPAARKPKETPSKKSEPVTAKETERKIAPMKGDEVIPMDRIRQLIAEHMVYSKRTSAHVTSVGEADVTDMVKLREGEKEAFGEREGFKLTYTPFFAKAVIDGVKAFPMVNVSVDEKNIIKHKDINLGVATALENGNLIVPVVKNADDLSMTGLARQIYDLSARARSNKLNPDDIQGGTITITNVGTFGTLFGSPIINQPQAAIIGVGSIQKRPVVKEIDGEDAIAIRKMMYVSITYDHRVIDGMLAGQCLAAIIDSLENINEETVSL